MARRVEARCKIAFGVECEAGGEFLAKTSGLLVRAQVRGLFMQLAQWSLHADARSRASAMAVD